MAKEFFLRADKKRYCFYRISRYRDFWGVISYNGNIKDDNLVKGLSSATIFDNREKADKKLETFCVKAREKNFIKTNRDDIEKIFPTDKDFEILDKKISLMAIKNREMDKSDKTLDEKKEDTKKTGLPTNFISQYSIENNIKQKHHHSYFQSIWNELDIEMQKLWIDTHPIKK